MCSIISKEGKEINTAKRQNFPTELKEYEDILFNKKNNEVQNEKNLK